MFKMKNVSKFLLGAAIVVLASCGGEEANVAATNADSLANAATADSLAKVAAEAAGQRAHGVPVPRGQEQRVAGLQLGLQAGRRGEQGEHEGADGVVVWDCAAVGAHAVMVFGVAGVEGRGGARCVATHALGADDLHEQVAAPHHTLARAPGRPVANAEHHTTAQRCCKTSSLSCHW